VLFPGG